MKKTPWYPINVLPVRDGVYEIQTLLRPAYSHFHSGIWHCMERKKESAFKHPLPSMGVYRHATGWRGLAEEGEQS